ncbi:hypothetical protein ACLOJK_017688 [Asimina triloba]
MVGTKKNLNSMPKRTTQLHWRLVTQGKRISLSKAIDLVTGKEDVEKGKGTGNTAATDECKRVEKGSAKANNEGEAEREREEKRMAEANGEGEDECKREREEKWRRWKGQSGKRRWSTYGAP